MKSAQKIIGGLSALVLSASAFAGPVYEYNNNGGQFGGAGGAYGYDSLFASFDTDTNAFEWTVDYAADNAADTNVDDSSDTADGGWIVVSNGPNPKGVVDQLAILYFDSASQDVWAYAYDGTNSSNSWQSQAFLGYFEDAYTTVGSVSTLAIDASDINDESTSGLSEGVAFGPLIGIWFHPSFNLSATGDANGLSEFTPRTNAWYDDNNETTTKVPAPATLLLLGLGLITAGLRRKFA